MVKKHSTPRKMTRKRSTRRAVVKKKASVSAVPRLPRGKRVSSSHSAPKRRTKKKSAQAVRRKPSRVSSPSASGRMARQKSKQVVKRKKPVKPKKPIKHARRAASKRPARKPPAHRKRRTKPRSVRWKAPPAKPRKRPIVKTRIPLLQLKAERPQIEAFLSRLTSVRFPGRVRVTINANHTIDGEALIQRPEDTNPSDFVFEQEQIYWMVADQFPRLGDVWLKLGAIFKRLSDDWKNYRLPIFRGKEAVIMNYATIVSVAGEYWIDFRKMISDVLNAHREPSPKTGEMRPVYKLTHILVRLHRSIDPPLY